MRITAVNGSPKPTGGTSALIIGQMEKLLGERITSHQAARLVSADTPPGIIAEMLEADVLLIVFPLYVDSLPSPLIELLTRLEPAAKGGRAKPQVFAIVNCGFFESKQNAAALDMVAHFARRAGLAWGYGLGIGGGGMLSGPGENWSSRPVKGIYRALGDMASAIREKESRGNVFVGPGLPRFVYKAAAGFKMRREAKRSGVRDIRARPYLEKERVVKSAEQ